MLLEPHDWSLAYRVDELLPRLSDELAQHVSPETHSSAVELHTGVHGRVAGAIAELRALRVSLSDELAPLGLRAGASGVHPFAVWNDVEVTDHSRYQALYGSLRELARREPTFALHVHVAIPDPETAVHVLDRLRTELPLLLALSANSPFWQGRDTGLASVRTPLFGAFPRVGIPRAFGDYGDYVESIDLLVRCDAIPDPSYLWWDARLQPALGTIEVRIMDAQSTVDDSSALLALVQCLVRSAAQRPPVDQQSAATRPEVIAENRFLAARDGMEARMLDAELGCRRPARELLEELLGDCREAAEELGCRDALAGVETLRDRPGAARQRVAAQTGDKLPGLVATLSEDF